jgi:hypothetical protein
VRVGDRLGARDGDALLHGHLLVDRLRHAVGAEERVGERHGDCILFGLALGAAL